MNNIQSIINCPKEISILVLNRNYEYIMFNDAHRREIFRDHGKYPKIGESIFNYFRPKYKESFDKILEGESFSNLDEGDANDFWESSWSPYYDGGEIVGIVGFAQDITEKITYQQQIEDNASLLDAILECSPEISVFAIDLDYKLIAFNRVFSQSILDLHGIAVDLDMSMIEIPEPRDRIRAKSLYDRVFSGEHIHETYEWGDKIKQRWTHLAPIYSKKTQKIIGLSCFGTKVYRIEGSMI